MIAREYSGVAGLARAPWEERDDAAALDAADAREAQRAVDDTDPRHLAAALDLGAVSLRMRATSAGRFGATVLRTAYLGGDPAAVSAAAWWERLS